MKRGFHWHDKAWYAQYGANRGPEIGLGLYDDEGGTSGEMTIRWHAGIGARLEAFSDSWETLATFGDLLQALANLNDPSQEEIVEVLKACGFEDMTHYNKP
jgi:hypothetical protein